MSKNQKIESPSIYENRIARMMDKYRYSGDKPVFLVLRNQQLEIVKRSQLKSYETILDRFNDVDLRDGLSSKRWARLGQKCLSLHQKDRLQ